jgi:hypothetical protein
MPRKKKPETVELTGRERTLDEIKKLHDFMRNEVIEAGVMNVHYDVDVRDFPNRTNEQLEAYLVMLRVIRDGVFQQLLNVRHLRPEDWWANIHGLFGQHQLREQKLLKIEQKKLRVAWRNRGKIQTAVHDLSEDKPA